MSKKKSIIVLGSTGSIGKQALEVIEAFPDQFELYAITANQSSDLLIEQGKKYKPNTVVICDESKYQEVDDALFEDDIKVFAGHQSLNDIVSATEVDIVLTAMVGYSGLDPTIHAIKAGKTIALANKETLVAAGDLISKLAHDYGVQILPVDSEHSAIFQCLVGEFENPIEKIYLTASGGPFRGLSRDQLKNIKKEAALKHPNWTMGAKITIDSATMMNKGLEVIEAKWLFNLKPNQIDVVVHPQSIVHSLVQFEDGAMKAQMGLPDMKIPIQYAFSYPDRLKTSENRFDFMDYPEFSFEKPDLDTFKNLGLAYHSLEEGGNIPCVLNAVNEISVDAFLQDKIGFLDIGKINEEITLKFDKILKPSYEDLVQTNEEARIKAKELI
jgi:1-deoxy-D-xylulose-5-phosphate reductoisomerase